MRDPSKGDDTILHHNPAFGHPVAIGSTVDLEVNQYSDVAANRKSNGMVLFRHRAPNGFLKQHVRVKVNRSEFTYEMFDDFVKPGQEIWLLIPYEQPVRVLLYLDDELVGTTRYD